MKLSQLAKQTGTVRIVTYSLPDLPYARQQLGRRPRDIFLLCHSQFRDQACQIKKALPQVHIATNDQCHSKVCLIAPNTIYIGSANFGKSDWHETLIGVRSQQAHEWYVQNSFEPLWETSQRVV